MLKSVGVVSGLVVLIAVASYPVIVHPRLYPERYRERQLANRVKPLEETQPGGVCVCVCVCERGILNVYCCILSAHPGMKVWKDPFERKKK